MSDQLNPYPSGSPEWRQFERYKRNRRTEFAPTVNDQLSKVVPCQVCGESEPFSGACGSSDPRALCKSGRIESAAAAPVEVEGDVSRAEYVAGAVAAAWCKHDLSVREHRCKEAATMIRTLARQLAEAKDQASKWKSLSDAAQLGLSVQHKREVRLQSQLAEATRRVTEVEEALRQISSDNHAGLRVQQVAQAALTKSNSINQPE